MDKLRNKPPYIPKDAVPVEEGPLAAWQWLLKAGITPEEATSHGMRWHEKTFRLLIPVFDAGVMQSVIGRAVYGERPKYIKMSGRDDALYRVTVPGCKSVVVVEDVLSARAVGRAGVSAVAILGTAISDVQAAAIAEGASTVVGWFDDDPAGHAAWSLLRKRMGLYPVELQRIQTAQDPKLLHRKELRAKLQSYIGA